MVRTAANIMQTDFAFVDCDATVAEAEEFFESGELSALPVLNPDRTVFGLLTPRNLAHFHRRPLNNPRAFHAWEICDARPLVTMGDTTVDELTSALLDSPAHHVLIINEEQQLIGVVATEHLLQNHAMSTREQALEQEQIRPDIFPAGRRPS